MLKFIILNIHYLLPQDTVGTDYCKNKFTQCTVPVGIFPSHIVTLCSFASQLYTYASQIP